MSSDVQNPANNTFTKPWIYKVLVPIRDVPYIQFYRYIGVTPSSLSSPFKQYTSVIYHLLSHFFGILTCGLHKETVPPFYTEKVMVIMSPRYEPNMGAVSFFTSVKRPADVIFSKKKDRIRFSWSFRWENMDFSPNRTSVFSHGKIQAKSTADVPNTWKTPHQSPHPQEFP